MRESAALGFDGRKLLIFSDPSTETLARRRAIKPLTIQLQAKNISSRWGFPVCLTAKNQGISADLRFPEDLKEFCTKLGLPYPNLDNWEKIGAI